MRALTYLIVLICLHAKSCDEPEHYSWNLGKPDNIEETEIICDSCSQKNQLFSEFEQRPLYYRFGELEPSEHKDCLGSYCEIP